MARLRYHCLHPLVTGPCFDSRLASLPRCRSQLANVVYLIPARGPKCLATHPAQVELLKQGVATFTRCLHELQYLWPHNCPIIKRSAKCQSLSKLLYLPLPQPVGPMGRIQRMIPFTMSIE